MKKIFCLLAFLMILLFGNSSQAQITITNNDLPVSGNMYRVSIGQAFAGMDETLTGANYTWDYSQLTPSSQTVDTFVSVLSTGLVYSAVFFFSSSYALKSNSPTLTLGPVTINYEYDFYKKATSGYVQTGYGANINNSPLPIPFSPKDTIYRFPLHYNDVGSCPSAFSATVPTIGYYGGNKTRTDTVDGWGTLTTPYGTFSVLRVKSVIREIDSIHVDAFNYGFLYPRPVVTEYKWLGTGQGVPLLQINTTGGAVTQIVYRDSLRTGPLSVMHEGRNGAQDFDFTVFPNPSTGKVVLQFKLDKTEKISLALFDLIGNKLFSEDCRRLQPGDNLMLIDLSEKKIPAGTYLLKMEIGGKSSIMRLSTVSN